MPAFRDHFSGHAATYSQFRPRYPEALYGWLASLVPAETVVWDCATGNGQAAVALADRFARVIATDASATQIEAAEPHEGVDYHVASASESGLGPHSVGLITVAQALHWFDHDAFAAEVHRVLQPGGVVVAWCYELFEVTPAVDASVLHLYRDIVGADWPPERRYIETGYRDIPWPWTRLEVPSFTMEAAWTVEQTLGYLRTWSATQRYHQREGHDPVARIETPLREAWGTEPTRTARWPLGVIASRVG